MQPFAATATSGNALWCVPSLTREFAHVTPDTKVLDIGCGWGACLEYLATTRGVKNAYGVTLSSAQMEEITRRKIPGAKADCCAYAK